MKETPRQAHSIPTVHETIEYGASVSSSVPVKRDDSTSMTYVHSRRRYPHHDKEERSLVSDKSTRATDIRGSQSKTKVVHSVSHSKSGSRQELTLDSQPKHTPRSSIIDRDISFGRSNRGTQHGTHTTHSTHHSTHHSTQKISLRSQSPVHKCRKDLGQPCCCERLHECQSHDVSSLKGDVKVTRVVKTVEKSSHDDDDLRPMHKSCSSTSAHGPTPVVGHDRVESVRAPVVDHETSHNKSRKKSGSSSSSSSSNSRPSVIDGMKVRYVEIPMLEYVEKRVPKKEVVFKERRVPKKVIENVEKIVEVPEVREVVKEVEVPIQLLKPKEEPVVIAQSIQPVVTASKRYKEVSCSTFDPVVVPVDVYIPLPVHTLNEGDAVVKVHHERVPRPEVPTKQWNSLVFSVNKGQDNDFLEDLLVKDAEGKIQTLPPAEKCDPITPMDSWKP